MDGVVSADEPGAAGRWRLAAPEVRARAARLRVLLTDVDGTLTDGGVYVSADGEALKRFSLRDGMGVERLREVGIETAFVTRERSPIVTKRAEKLRVPVFAGVQDKAAALPELRAALGLSPDEDGLAYLGDDVNDAGIMARVAPRGLVGAPSDGFGEILEQVHYVTRAVGGHGAFREFAEALRIQVIAARGEGTKG